MPVAPQETIWIVGASAGIGRALAQLYASKGAKLVLSARSHEALDALNQKLGGSHVVMPLDVSDRQAMDQAINTLKTNQLCIDRAIFMAAIYKPQSIETMDLDFADQLLRVNVLGCFIFGKAIFNFMKQQSHGQIAICGSVAAYQGLPNGQPYSASKAAIQNFTESLYLEAPQTIDIKLISPGFVRTRTTDLNEFEMPHLMEPNEAAVAIEKGLKTKRFEVHFPKKFTWQLKILALLPYRLSLKIIKTLF